MHVKYLEERHRADGTPYWVVAPKKRLREATGMGYQQFSDRDEAVSYARDLAQAVEDYRRRNSGSVHVKDDTVDGLLSYYMTTRHYGELAESTRTNYRSLMRTISKVRLGQSNTLFGQMLYSNIDPKHADAFYDHLRKDGSPTRAVDAVKVCRKAWNVAMRGGLVRSNPWTKMNITKPAPRIVLWEPEEVERFISTADEMGEWSMGTVAMLCYHLCQRPGDMRQLRWKHFTGEDFDFVQAKTGERVEVMASPQLLQRIGKPRHPEICIAPANFDGDPISNSAFYAKYRRILSRSGLPQHLQARDWRRTGATEMAEAGCTEDELRSVTGHRSRGILNIYVRPTKKLSRAGMMKRFG